MMRPFAWMPVVALALLGGCQQGPGVGVDPFGRTTIPPPATGSAAILSGTDPYYSSVTSPAPGLVPIGPAAASVSATRTAIDSTPTVIQKASNWIPASSESPSDGSHRLQPIPSYLDGRNEIKPPAEAAEVSPPTRAVTPVSYDQPIADTPPEYPRSTTGGLRWSGGSPQKNWPVQETSSSGTELASLPMMGNSTTSSQRQTVSVRREPTDDATAAGSSHSRYGHAPDYTWLRGRLEYHAGGRQWKLRYIPLDGRRDDNGGTVVLPATSALEDFQDGDFVSVHGKMGGSDSESIDSAASYIASRVAPLE